MKATEFNAYALCPCESGRKAKFCCLKDSRKEWRRAPARLAAAQPRTGQSVDRCAAAFTNDCGGGISREHPISRTLLEETVLDRRVKVGGLPWQPNETFSLVGIDSLIAKVLCERHNNLLGPLDESAGKLSRAFHRFDEELHAGAIDESMFLVAGEDIERWMLKTAVGFAAAKWTSATLPSEAHSLLFEGADWPDGWGLYLNTAREPTVYHTESWDLQTFVRPDGRLAAVRIALAGLPLYLLMGKPDVPGSFGIKRPEFVRLKGTNGGQRQIVFSWAIGQSGTWIELERSGSYDGQPPNWPEWARD